MSLFVSRNQINIHSKKNSTAENDHQKFILFPDIFETLYVRLAEFATPTDRLPLLSTGGNIQAELADKKRQAADLLGVRVNVRLAVHHDAFLLHQTRYSFLVQDLATVICLSARLGAFFTLKT